MLGRIFSYLRAVWAGVSGGVILLLGAAVVELALPWPIKWLVDSVFGEEEYPGFLGWLPGFGEGGAVSEAIMSIALLVLVLGMLHKGLTMLGQLWLIKAGNLMVRNLRMETFAHLYRLPLSYHDRSKVGDLLYKACYDSYALQALLSQVFVPVFSGLCVVVGVVVIMLRLDVMLTLVTAATVPLFWLNLKRFEKRMEDRSRRFHESESEISSQVQESLGSIRVIQAFTLEEEKLGRLGEQSEVSVRENMRKSATELIFSFLMGVLISVGTAAVIWLGSNAVLEGRLQLGEILVFLAYLGTLYQPIHAFSQGASVYHSSAAQMKRVFDLLDEEQVIEEEEGAEKPEGVRGEVEFCEVSFRYDGRNRTLEEVTLRAPAGEKLALVGKTGSGKTTLANLLLRFYDPSEGVVLLDGRDVRTLSLSWLRGQVSIVFQEPLLFSATIGENIAFGRPGAAREELEAAARQAQAHEFIVELPQGYDTVLGERGVNLSGGQKQRISIARAFLKDAPILILDEPTSALDAGTEGELLKALEALMEDRTTLIIAHRLSTIRRADRIAVMEEGKVVEEGTHDELLALGGRYAELHRAQSG